MVRNQQLVSSILDEGIWVSKPDAFNDPFDCNLRPPHLGAEFDKRIKEFIADIESNPSRFAAKVCAIVQERGGDASPAIAEQIISAMWSGESADLSRQFTYETSLGSLWSAVQASISKLGVLCLSEDPDNPLLWAHYADEHRGFCIEFERSESNILGNDANTFPVRYSSTYPDMSMSDLFFQYSQENEDSSEKSLEETYIGSVLLTKSDHWSYENEWRLIAEGNNLLMEYPGNISSVIFGLRMPLIDRKFLMRCYGKSVNYREVVMQNGSFSLQIKDI